MRTLSVRLSNVLLASAGALGLLLIAAPATAHAQASVTIFACYPKAQNANNPGTGVVYRINKPLGSAPAAPLACSSGDIEFSWNEVGPKGDKGDVGPQGLQGVQGAKGDKGDQGIQGEKGDKGDQGVQGIQGPKGDQGVQGIQGEKGDKGDQGIQGIQGTQGIQGEKGDKGDTGAQGIQGEKGDKGDQGEVGPMGPQGPQGTQGQTGQQGPQGDIGPIGPQGPSGLSGHVILSGGYTPANAGQITRLTVSCPVGKKVLGGGYSNPDTKGTNNTVLASFPSSATAWEVQIFNPSGGTNFTVVPYVICATVAP